MMALTAADESHCAVWGADLQAEGPHPRISGEEQVQGGVKTGRITQDLMIRDKRKERAALAHPGSNLTLTPLPLNSLTVHP